MIISSYQYFARIRREKLRVISNIIEPEPINGVMSKIQEVYKWIIENRKTPYIRIDASVDGVILPEKHIGNGEVILNISPKSILDFSYTDNGFSFFAGFKGNEVRVNLPFESVLAIYSKETSEGIEFKAGD